MYSLVHCQIQNIKCEYLDLGSALSLPVQITNKESSSRDEDRASCGVML